MKDRKSILHTVLKIAGVVGIISGVVISLSFGNIDGTNYTLMGLAGWFPYLGILTLATGVLLSLESFRETWWLLLLLTLFEFPFHGSGLLNTGHFFNRAYFLKSIFMLIVPFIFYLYFKTVLGKHPVTTYSLGAGVVLILTAVLVNFLSKKLSVSEYMAIKTIHVLVYYLWYMILAVLFLRYEELRKQ